MVYVPSSRGCFRAVPEMCLLGFVEPRARVLKLGMYTPTKLQLQSNGPVGWPETLPQDWERDTEKEG